MTQALVETSYTPKTLVELDKFAATLAESGMVPTAYKGKPKDIVVAVIRGAEIGLAPLQSLESLAVINGRPSLYGDAVPAVAQTSPQYEFHREYFEGDGDSLTAVCEVKRKNGPLHVVKFSVADAKKANLWGKAGPWTQYPRRMLQMRSRSFAFRDQFPDALKGIGVVEEVQDIKTVEPIPMPKAVETTATPAKAEEVGMTKEQLAEFEKKIQPAAEPEPTTAEEAAFISAGQRKRLFVLLEESGKTKDDLKEHLLTMGITSTKDIPKAIYEQVSTFCSTKKEG